MGKILLAGMEPAEVRRILAGELEAYTPHTITKPEALRRELAKVRRCGYALDREEITRGIVCVAAPIRNGEGDTVAAISIAFPAYINEERGIKGEIAAVTRCASEVTRLLGGTPGGGGASRRDVGRRAPAAKKRG
jgi:IclR family acetate operon transcriptional repressor